MANTEYDKLHTDIEKTITEMEQLGSSSVTIMKNTMESLTGSYRNNIRTLDKIISDLTNQVDSLKKQVKELEKSQIQEPIEK